MASLLSKLHAITISVLSLIVTTAVVPGTEGVPSSVTDWEEIWTGVLARNVDPIGRIDFASLVRDHTDLDKVVAS